MSADSDGNSAGHTMRPNSPSVRAPHNAQERPRLMQTQLSAVAPQPIDWLWKGVLALGKLTMIVGDPGQSKSLATLDLAARLTSGTSWPDGSKVRQPGSVVLLNAEDGADDTIRPRFDAANGDATRVTIVEGVRGGVQHRAGERLLDLSRDIPVLEELVDALPKPVLVVIDPISNYLQGIDTHRDAELRTAMMPLVEMLRRTDAAGIAVAHLNKSSGAAAMHRVGGSIGFVGVSRQVMLVTPDPTAPKSSRRLFLSLKSNLSESGLGFGYSITSSSSGDPKLEWEPDPVDISAAEALVPPVPTRPRRRTKRDEAQAMLEEKLQHGPVPSTEISTWAQEAGIPPRTLARAKKDLDVEPVKRGFQGPWTLKLRDDSPLPEQS